MIAQIDDAGLTTVLRWHPEENLILAGKHSGIYIWDALIAAELQVLDEHISNAHLNTNYAISVCWLTKDIIAIVGHQDITIIDVVNEKMLKTLNIRSLENVDCHGDGKLASAKGVIDLHAGEIVRAGSDIATFAGYASDVVDVAWSPDGDRFVAHGNTSLCRFGVYDGQTTGLVAELQGSYSRQQDYSSYPDSIAWQPDGDLIVAVGQFDIRLWDTTTYRMLHRYDGFEVGHHHIIGPATSLTDEERRQEMYSKHTKCPGS